MARIEEVSDHGLEVLKKAATVPDDTYKTRYSLRTELSDAALLAIEEAIKNGNFLNVVDQIDTTPLLDVSVTNIPASSGTPLTIVASLAADIKGIHVVEDIGEYMGLYSDPSGTPVLEAILPLGGGRMDLKITAGTELGLRHMKDVAITGDFIAINFLG